ncbi:unnamed protein product [Clonostachys rosea]|uniref:WW domain-containing protein n=1 Tax=Bionectria ochroleuca TaxID=29856 RepID=A0ABY6V4V9_BIOOC|nr:unnamed protein product [Clonostachys rosea]
MSSQLPPEVPAGWSAQWSARHQTWVYVDLKSLNIQWMCPTEPPPGHVITPPVSPTTPSKGEPSVPAGWKPKWHQSYGAWFYVNSQTGKAQWNRPQYAAIPANAYSPIDHSHKPVDWDECAPSPLVTKFPKSLHLSLNLNRQPMSGFEHLFSGNVEPTPLTPLFFSPPPPKAAPPSPPRLSIDTKHAAQGRQRPVSPAHTFIPAFRPRAISDCPPVLPDVPLSQIEAPHPPPLNPYTQARHSFLMPPGPGPNVARHQTRHSMSNFPTNSHPYGGYGSAYAPPPPPQPKPQPKPQRKVALGVPIQKVNANRGHHRWASTPEIVLRKPLTPKIEMATELPANEIPVLQEKEVLAPTIIVAPMPTPPLDPTTPPLDPTPKQPTRAPLGDIRQLLRTKTIGYTQRSWPVGAQDRGYYPTRVNEAEEDGYESDSSYCTDYAEDEPERSPVVSFTPILNKPTGRESWELAY